MIWTTPSILIMRTARISLQSKFKKSMLALRKKQQKQGLSYGDSDDEDEGSAELINLDTSTASGVQRDRTHSAAEHVPKLAKPE